MKPTTWHELGIEIGSATHGEIHTTCPWCSRDRKKKRVKCLSANLDKEVYFCHHCGAHGNLKGERAKGDYTHWNKPAYSKPKAPADYIIEGKPLAFLKSRGIGEMVAKRNKVFAGQVYMPQVEGEVNAIAFPYFRNGELVNIKWRDASKNFRLEAGAERILYGFDDIKDASTIIWVEGEIDKLSAEEAGFANCVSVPDGAPAPDSDNYSSKFSWFEGISDLLLSKKHIIAVDNDAPGRKLEKELARRLGLDRCARVEWPEGCKDANDVLKFFGPHMLKVLIETAQPYPMEGVFTPADVRDEIFKLYEDGLEKGLSTGWPSLDAYYLVRPGLFTVVTGIPNSGKSNFLDAMSVNLSKLHGWRFGVFSPENQPVRDHMSAICEKFVGKPFEQGPTQRMHPVELNDAIDWVSEHFHWILPDDDAEWTIDMILNRAQALVYRYGIRGLIIDPWNEIEHNRRNNETETDYISRALKKIRQFGRKTGVHIFIVVHPQKLQKDGKGNYPIPTLYDCAGSAHWRNKADNGLTVWRDFSDPRSIAVDIHVQKVRFRQDGSQGMATLSYNRVTATYHEPSRAYKEIQQIVYGESA